MRSVSPQQEAGLPFEALFLASPLAAIVSRLSDGRLLAVNDAWLALTGQRREDVIGRTTVELGHWPSADERARFVNQLPSPDTVQHLRLRDGVMHRVRLHTTVMDTLPEPLALVYITEATREFEATEARLQTEAALREANLGLQQQVELHAAIEKLARVGHWTNAQHSDSVVWSLGLFEIAGLEPRDLIARGDGRAGIHPDDRPAWQAAREAMDGRQVEFRWRLPDGQQRWFRTRIGQTSVAGNPQTDFGVVQDITAEREASERLTEQLKLLQNIAARVPGMMYQARLRADGKSVISYVNDVVRSMLEIEPAELEEDADVLFRRVHPDDRAEMIASLRRPRPGIWRPGARPTACACPRPAPAGTTWRPCPSARPTARWSGTGSPPT
ncbi:PAS domain-containing protein [Hydrogenophaga sp. UC242_50]|uniref:PAS domain-containing protein n=1 Tax=Hydrogenophaga sp. UC242_50 TaxID=3350169 RepID=UPI0036D38F6D